MEYHNSVHPNDPVPADLMSSQNTDDLCKWICHFIQETRKADREKYPPTSIRQLLAAFECMLSNNKVPFNILDKSDICFQDLHVGIIAQGRDWSSSKACTGDIS